MNDIQSRIYSYLKDGARIAVNAVGVSFPCINAEGNRQDIIRKMCKSHDTQIVIRSQLDNEYDEHAMIIVNQDNVDIGFIPKQSTFHVFLPNRRRPLVLNKGDTGMNTNEIFHTSNSAIEAYEGVITKFKAYQFKKDGESNIGLSIEFWLPESMRKTYLVPTDSSEG